MPRRCRVLIVDEAGIMRDALCALLARLKGCQVIGTASSGKDAIRALDSVRPDAVILDFTSSMTHGPELITIMRERQPGVRVLVLTRHAEPHFINASLRAGADGYVLKNDSRAELLAAIRSITAGRRYLSSALGSQVADGRLKPSVVTQPSQPGPAALTQREQQIIKLIAHGYRTREIAQSLSLSHKTVEKHRTNLMRKLGLRTATAVAAYAVADGYVSR